jgi:hypothetical protein
MDRRRSPFSIGLAVGALVFSIQPAIATAHGIVGKRFFPATIVTDDPFVADELSLPTVSTQRKSGDAADDPYQRETEFSTEFTKRITPDFGLGFELGGKYVEPDGTAASTGRNNLAISAKYQLYKNDLHEAILSLGLDTDIGGSGTNPGEADRYYTFIPAVFFGKGFGDLPDGMALLRPLAITGSLGIAVPTSARTRNVTVDPDTGDADVSFERHPDKLVTGFAIEYSIPYLQSAVRDAGIGAPFNRMIPLVEFAFETPLDRGGGSTTGTVNPGVLWAGQTFQLGVEAVLPINSDSSHGVGVRAQLHFFLDDIFPRTLGKPLFGD